MDMACGQPVDIENPCRTIDVFPVLRRPPCQDSSRLPKSPPSACFSWTEPAEQSMANGQRPGAPSHENRARRGVNKSVRLEAAPDGDLLACERGKCRGMPLCGMTRSSRPTLTRRFPPFSGALEHGYVYGRGALDAKGVAVVELMALVALKRIGQPIDRDVILLATADEETGGRAGAGWIVQHRPELLGSAEYLLTEGDHIHVAQGGRKVVQVAVAEKTPCWVKLIARGEGGHGSTPPAQTAVTRLIRALDKVRRYNTGVRLVRPVEEYFAALAPLEREPLRSKLGHLSEALEDPAFLAEFTRNPRQNALIRNTMTPTVLEGSPQINVIPEEASAQLDCRLLPGERPADFLALLREVIADETIRVDTLLSFPASSSDSSSGLMAVIRKLAATDLGGAPVIPSVIPGFTDSHYFRDHGVASYGFVPFVLSEDDEKTVHGVNERVSVENLRDGVRRLVALLRALPAR